MSVSARVVKTRSSPVVAGDPGVVDASWYGNPMVTPWLRPIQLACISLTRAGQPGRVSSADSSSSA